MEARVLPAFAGAKVSALELRDVQDLADQLLANGHGASTIRNTFMGLRALYRRAVARGDIAVNPTAGLQLPAVRGRRDRIASVSEADKLLAVLPDGDRALWSTAFLAGLRRGELMALDVEHAFDANSVASRIAVERSYDPVAGMTFEARHTDDVRHLVTTGVAIASSAVALLSALYLVHVYALDRDTAMFDLEEGGLVTWASSSATFSTGVVALLLSFIDSSQKLRGPAVALGTAFLSFDDANFLHERIGFGITGALNISDSYVQIIWPTLYFPLLVVVAVLLLQLVQDTTMAQRLIFLGLLALVSGVAMEIAGIALDQAHVDAESWPWTVEIILEEGIELAGWILITTGAAVRLITLAHDHSPVADA